MKSLCILMLCLLSILSFSQLPVGGLVAHYSFDNQLNDRSNNGNDGMASLPITSATDRFGNNCGALKFNGSFYVRIPNSKSLKALTYSMSVTAWVQTEKPATNPANLNLSLLSKGEDSNMQLGLQVMRSFGDSYCEIKISESNSFRDNNYSAHPIDFDKWHFITLSYEENWMQYYIDGKLAWQGMNNKPFLANDADLTIGKFGNSYFKGNLDDLRIYNRGLSNSEIQALFIDQSAQKALGSITLTTSGNIEKNTDKGKCHAHITFPNPQASATCSQVEIKQLIGLKNGDFFPLGENTITYEAVSSVGTKEQKSFTIKVFDTEPPVIVCNDNIFTTTTNKLGNKVVYKNPIVTDNCTDFKLNLLQGYQSGELFPIGVTEVVYEAVDFSGNKSVCKFSVTVQLEIAPDAIKSSSDSKKTEITSPKITPSNITTNDKPVIDSSTVSNTKAQSVFTKKKSTDIPKPQIVSTNLTSIPTNPSALNSSASERKIAQKKTTIDKLNVELPVARQVEREMILGIKNEIALTFYPAKMKEPEKIKGIDKVEIPVSNSKPPVSHTNDNKVIVSDAPEIVSSTASNKSKTIDTRWEITFVHDLVQKNDPGKCGAIVNYNAPKIEGISGIKAQLKSGKPSGSFFKIGSTANLFSAQDDAGRIKESAFNIVVKDNEPPYFKCPSDTVILLPQNRRGIMYFYEPPSAYDNCDIDSVSQTLGSKNGCFLEIGVHPFTFKAIDKSGNSQLCTYSVIVKDELVSTEKKEEETVEDVPHRLSPLLNIGKDSIKYEHLIDVNGCVLTALFYDDGEEDNDSVSIIFNGQIIVNKAKIKLKENGFIKRVLHLSPDMKNYVVAKAWNTGKYGLNTLKMEVYEGDLEETDRREFKNLKPVFSKVLHSKPGNAGGMILNCQ